MYMINGQIVDTGCRQVALWGLVNRGLPPLPLRRPMTCPMTAHWKRYPRTRKTAVTNSYRRHLIFAAITFRLGTPPT